MSCRDCSNDRHEMSEAGLCASCEVAGWQYEAGHADPIFEPGFIAMQIATWAARQVPSPRLHNFNLQEAA